MLLWFLWLRRGHIGTLASALKAFDKLNKPARSFSVNWPLISEISVGCSVGTAIGFAIPLPKTGAQDSKAAAVPEPPQRADETGKPLTGEMKEDAVNDKKPQEGTTANQRAAGNDDKAPGNDKD